MSKGRALAVRVGIIATAVAAASIPIAPALVERLFSTGLYPRLQSGLTRMSNMVPFALFDALLITASGWFLWMATREVGRRSAAGKAAWLWVLGRIGLRSLTLAAALYLGFLVAWGFNYRRLPLTDRLVQQPQEVTVDSAQRLVTVTVDQLNALHSQAHAAPDGSAIDHGSLAKAFAAAQDSLGIRARARPGRPKRTLLDFYFRSAGVAGMTDPYFLEILVASDLLPVERAFVIAHEWGHLAGFADEGEANFIGWLTCLKGSAADEYSGWLFFYSELLSGLPRDVRNAATRRLAEGPRDDLRAIAERIRRNVRPRVSTAGWQVYDRYLRANRVEAGAASYREVVQLILAADFDANWSPKLKTGFGP